MSSSALVNRIRSAAGNYPGNTALVFPAEKSHPEISITYSELLSRTDQLADFFRKKGLKENQRVAILFPKCIDSVVVMLAVLSCKATYIPIDAELPLDRIQLLLRESDPHCLIAHPDHFPSHIPCQAENISEQLSFLHASVTFLPVDDESEFPDLAAILYTSGSTGTPKGVCLSEKNIDAFVKWSLETFDVSSTDVFSSVAPFHFDLSLFDIYAGLSTGGTIILFDANVVKNARLLSSFLASYKISVTYATPSQLNVLYHFGTIRKETSSALRIVMFAGEIYPAQQLHLLMKLWKHATFHNLYGPTETNVCTWYKVPAAFDETRIEAYPIGKVCKQLHGRISSEGELLIAGDNVMQGYRKQKRLNEAAFFEFEGEKFYRTGDRVEEDADGNLLYAGRIDRMIKKRGYRIEPGEIESVLSDMDGVAECAVTGEKAEDGFTQLVAHVVMKTKELESVMSVKQFCASKLPLYMIPDKIVFREGLPKTSSGKIDLGELVSGH